MILSCSLSVGAISYRSLVRVVDVGMVSSEERSFPPFGIHAT